MRIMILVAVMLLLVPALLIVWLGRVGNSGNTTQPHLHIHGERGGTATSILDGEGVPIRFDGHFLVRNSLVRRRS
ncbi:MAG: hypothetical protein ACR2H9_18165 [Longimicrobiaceae bacterium]